MCDMCGDDPKWKSEAGSPERAEEVHEDMMQKIMDFGCVVTFVYGTDDRPNFFYTIGRSVFDKPELLLVGNLAPEVGQKILNDICEQDNTGKASVRDLADNGGTMPEVLGGGYEVKFLRCDPDSSQMYQAINLAGPDVESIQVLWPDAEGNFPDQPGFQRADAIQPVYAR